MSRSSSALWASVADSHLDGLTVRGAPVGFRPSLLEARLRTIKDLDEAAGRLGQVCGLLLDQADSALREAVFAVVKREGLEVAVRQVERLVRPPDDMCYRELKESYRRVRTFLPSFLRTVRFGATPAGRPILEALEFLRRLEESEDRLHAGDPPISLVTRTWRNLVHAWGGGEVASAEGLRFVVPVRTIHASPNPKYFGYERGVTYYNLVSDQFTGLNAIVVPGTLRDSLDDETKRRRILNQLNKGEDRHKLARAVFHGKQGELRQRYREGQEDQLGALGLVVNMIVLWNTLYINAALEQLAREGYAFSVPEAVTRGELRPLRNPDEVQEEVA